MLKDQLVIEIDRANAQIEELELTTHVVSPENTLSDIITFENASEDELNKRKLKQVYMRKRKLLYLQERLRNNFSLSCSECGEDIEIERLLIMLKARFCVRCATSV